MAKMIKQKYRTLCGDVKLNCYYITVPKKVVGRITFKDKKTGKEFR